MTERLYHTDSYATQFSASVVGASDDRRVVWLDRTAFYPTSGGQPHDLGTLAGVSVVDVVDDDERIRHHLADPLPEVTVVEGVIDWARRFDHMQQHTGQHLLSAILADAFGLETVSVHFGAESSTLDVAAASVSESTLREVEMRANAAIQRAVGVSAGYEESTTATGLRKPTDRSGTIRVVTIDGLDRSACGGTHCASLGELGLVLFRGAEKTKGQTRITFLSGMRAVRRASTDQQLLSAAAASLGAGVDEVPSLVAARLDELRKFSDEHRRQRDLLARYRAAELVAAAPMGADGVRRVRFEGSSDELRRIAQAATELSAVRFVGLSSAPPTIVLAISAGLNGDAGAELKTQLAAVGGRGGGNARLAQGTVPNLDLLASLSAQL